MMGRGFGGFLVWIVIAVLAIAGVVLAVLYYQKRRGEGSSGPDALDILKKRFARGDITREEYEQIRSDLRE